MFDTIQSFGKTLLIAGAVGAVLFLQPDLITETFSKIADEGKLKDLHKAIA